MNVRTLICTVVGLLAVVLLIAFTPRETYLPKGMLLPREKILPAISANQVAIYHQAPSGDFKRLGNISIEQGFKELNAPTKDLLFQKVKEMAASIGANGVIVTLLMPTNELSQRLIFRGTAIYSSSNTARSKK